MKAKRLFGVQPKMTKEDRERLSPHIANEKVVSEWVKTANEIDLKLATVIEAERDKPRLTIISKLHIALCKLERDALIRKVYS